MGTSLWLLWQAVLLKACTWWVVPTQLAFALHAGQTLTPRAAPPHQRSSGIVAHTTRCRPRQEERHTTMSLQTIQSASDMWPDPAGHFASSCALTPLFISAMEPGPEIIAYGLAVAGLLAAAGALFYSVTVGDRGLGSFLSQEKSQNLFYTKPNYKAPRSRGPKFLSGIKLPKLDFVEVFDDEPEPPPNPNARQALEEEVEVEPQPAQPQLQPRRQFLDDEDDDGDNQAPPSLESQLRDTLRRRGLDRGDRPDRRDRGDRPDRRD